MNKELDKYYKEQARLKRLAYAENGPNPDSRQLKSDMKNFIRNRDKYTCQNPECGMSESLYEKSYFEVHHINYDRENNNPWNLILLCLSCHARTFIKNSKQFWTKFYIEIMKKRFK